MSHKLKQSPDGSFEIVDSVSGRTVRKFYASGGSHKELTATYSVPQSENGTTYYLNSGTELYGRHRLVCQCHQGRATHGPRCWRFRRFRHG
jgi:hypothetical protein